MASTFLYAVFCTLLCCAPQTSTTTTMTVISAVTTEITTLSFSATYFTTDVVDYVSNDSVTSADVYSDNETLQEVTTSVSSKSRASNMEGLVSKETFETFENVSKYLNFVLLFSGLVLNVLNLLVFTSREMKSPSSMILTATSGSELVVVLLQATVKFVGLHFGAKMRYSYAYLSVHIYLSMYGSSVLGRSVYCFTIFVAVQRLVAVAFPLKSKRVAIMQRPAIVCVTVLASSVVYHVYIPFSYVVDSYQVGNETHYKFGYSDYYSDNVDVVKSVSLAGRIIFIYVPLLGCLVSNIALVFVLRYHTMNRKSLQSSLDSKQTRRTETLTTTTIMVSTVTFVLLVLPYQGNSLAVQFSDTYGMYRQNHWLYMTVHQVGTLCILLSSSSNFVFYFILGGVFRKTLLSKLRSCRSARDADTFPSTVGSSSTVNTTLKDTI